MHGQFLARLCALAIGAVTSGSPLPIRQPVSALVANDAGAVALVAGEVRVMDGGGFPVARLPALREPRAVARRQGRAGGGFAAAAGVLDDDDFNDPHDPDSEIEDPENILSDDAPAARRRERAVPPAGGVALAIGEAFAWVGRADGLWRLALAGGAAEKLALPAAGPVRAVASSASGRVVAVALDSGIVWSADGGAQFQRIVNSPVGVRRLAVTSSGRVYALSAEGLRRVDAGAAGTDAIVRSAHDVTACGSAVLVLVDRRLALVGGASSGPAESQDGRGEGDAPAPLAPLGAERLACSPDGAMWVAYGDGLWMSEDRGRSWTTRDDIGSLFPVSAAAVTRLGLWLGGGAGLALLPVRRPADAATADDGSLTLLREGAAGEGRQARRWRWWMAALPRVDLGFATAESNTRRDQRAFVLLSFSFDPRRASRADRQIDADARAAAGRDRAQRWLKRDMSIEGDLDPLAVEERDAVSRLLEP